MKRIIIAAMVAMAFFATTANAQEIEEEGPDSFFTSRDGDLQISFGGYDLLLGTSTDSYRSRPYTDVQFAENYSFGFNVLANADHSSMAYGLDYLDLNPFKSFHFDFDIASFGIVFNGGNAIRLGINYSVDNYAFKNKLTIDRTAAGIVPIQLPDDVKKSKLRGSYINVPLSIDIAFSDNVTLTPSAYVGILCKSITKYKAPKVKNDIDCLNNYHAGVGLSLNFEDVGLFCDYSLTPLFQNGIGPDANRITFGIVLLN